MLANPRRKLRDNGCQIFLLLGAHGITTLLLAALLLGVILLD